MITIESKSDGNGSYPIYSVQNLQMLYHININKLFEQIITSL